jgi:hypothetical protein
MKTLPAMQAKPLSAAVPGELVRIPQGGKMVLGIVVACEHPEIPSGRVLLLLENIPDQPKSVLGFLLLDDYRLSETCLSFGTEHVVIVHPTSPVVPTSSITRQDVSGLLLVGEAGQVIRSRLARDPTVGPAFFISLDGWKAIPPASAPGLRWSAAVLAWELRMLSNPLGCPPLPPVFTFSWDN